MHYLIILLGGLAYGVYLDATKHKIGKVPGDDLADNHSAGGWAAPRAADRARRRLLPETSEAP